MDLPEGIACPFPSVVGPIFEGKGWVISDIVSRGDWLWKPCTSSLDFLFINIWIVHFCEKIIYSVCVRLIQLNSGKKVESWKLSWKLGGVISPILTQSFFCIVIFLKGTGFNLIKILQVQFTSAPIVFRL